MKCLFSQTNLGVDIVGVEVFIVSLVIWVIGLVPGLISLILGRRRGSRPR